MNATNATVAKAAAMSSKITAIANSISDLPLQAKSNVFSRYFNGEHKSVVQFFGVEW